MFLSNNTLGAFQSSSGRRIVLGWYLLYSFLVRYSLKRIVHGFISRNTARLSSQYKPCQIQELLPHLTFTFYVIPPSAMVLNAFGRRNHRQDSSHGSWHSRSYSMPDRHVQFSEPLETHSLPPFEPVVPLYPFSPLGNQHGDRRFAQGVAMPHHRMAQPRRSILRERRASGTSGIPGTPRMLNTTFSFFLMLTPLCQLVRWLVQTHSSMEPRPSHTASRTIRLIVAGTLFHRRLARCSNTRLIRRIILFNIPHFLHRLLLYNPSLIQTSQCIILVQRPLEHHTTRQGDPHQRCHKRFLTSTMELFYGDVELVTSSCSPSKCPCGGILEF